MVTGYIGSLERIVEGYLCRRDVRLRGKNGGPAGI